MRILLENVRIIQYAHNAESNGTEEEKEIVERNGSSQRQNSMEEWKDAV